MADTFNPSPHRREYLRVEWRKVGQLDPETGLIDMAFDLPAGGVLRLLVPALWADVAGQALIDQSRAAGAGTKVQSSSSVGSPSNPGSMVPAKAVYPREKSSQADCADA